MKTKKKGRPFQDPEKKIEYKYSVWVTLNDKATIDKMVEDSGQSASGFISGNILHKSFKFPRRKTLPKTIKDQIIHLEKLSGLLALSALKVKDKEMISDNWIAASNNVKWISKIIQCRIFEELDLPLLKNQQEELSKKTEQMYRYLKSINDGTISPECLDLSERIHYLAKNSFAVFQSQYTTEYDSKFISDLWESDIDVFKEIKEIIHKLKSE